MIVHQIYFQNLLFVHVINDFVEEFLHDHYQAFQKKKNFLLKKKFFFLLFVIQFVDLQCVVHIVHVHLIRNLRQSEIRINR
jgi:hypothetical protein